MTDGFTHPTRTVDLSTLAPLQVGLGAFLACPTSPSSSQALSSAQTREPGRTDWKSGLVVARLWLAYRQRRCQVITSAAELEKAECVHSADVGPWRPPSGHSSSRDVTPEALRGSSVARAHRRTRSTKDDPGIED
jgi:hypothetical protein